MRQKKPIIAKKTRTIISGLLVGMASLYALVVYFEIPREELNQFFFATLLFFLTIIFFAIVATALIKGVGYLRNKISGKNISESLQEGDKSEVEESNKE